MSCCEYRWYDGFQSTSPTAHTWKIDWATKSGDQSGTFIFTSFWGQNDLPVDSVSSAAHYHERPWLSQLMQRLRQITGVCGDDVPFTATAITVTPLSYTTP